MPSPTDWGKRGLPGFLRDPNNEQVGVLPASGVFLGQWTRIDNAESFLLLYGTHAPFTMQIQWSRDGVVQDTDPFATITPQVRNRLGLFSVISPQSTFFRPFYRMKITNGSSPQFFAISDALILKTQFTGYDIDVDGPIPILGLGRLGISLNWGRSPSAWEPMQLTALKNQKVALAENLIEKFPVTDVGSSYKHLNTPGATIIKPGTGVLRRVVYNKWVSTSTLTFYDGPVTPANIIAILSYSLSGSNFTPNVVEYNARFTNGLTVVQTGSHDFTLVYD